MVHGCIGPARQGEQRRLIYKWAVVHADNHGRTRHGSRVSQASTCDAKLLLSYKPKIDTNRMGHLGPKMPAASYNVLLTCP